MPVQELSVAPYGVSNYVCPVHIHLHTELIPKCESRLWSSAEFSVPCLMKKTHLKLLYWKIFAWSASPIFLLLVELLPQRLCCWKYHWTSQFYFKVLVQIFVATSSETYKYFQKLYFIILLIIFMHVYMIGLPVVQFCGSHKTSFWSCFSSSVFMWVLEVKPRSNGKHCLLSHFTGTQIFYSFSRFLMPTTQTVLFHLVIIARAWLSLSPTRIYMFLRSSGTQK